MVFLNQLNYSFLLQIAVAEYLASVEWSIANSRFTCKLPHEVFRVYIKLLADEDPRVQKVVAENLPL